MYEKSCSMTFRSFLINRVELQMFTAEVDDTIVCTRQARAHVVRSSANKKGPYSRTRTAGRLCFLFLL